MVTDTKTYRIYLVTNTYNNKKYVGQTYQTLDDRWYDHVMNAKCGSDLYFHRAILKHGVEAFKIEPLVDDISESDIDAIEMKFIAEHRSSDPRYGYNGTSGGQGCRATRATLQLMSAGAHHVTIELAQQIHELIITMYNGYSSHKEIDAHVKSLYPTSSIRASYVILTHTGLKCVLCFDEDAVPLNDRLLVTRAPSSKPTSFRAQVSGWRGGTHWCAERGRYER